MVRFRLKTRKLQDLYTEEKGAHKYPPGVIDAFLGALMIIKGAKDERDLRAFRGLNYHKLKGKRQHQHSIYLNDQFRLVLEWEEDEQGKCLLIVAIEDYH
jgi:proteic killer suppression protein